MITGTPEDTFQWTVPSCGEIHAPSGIAYNTTGNFYATDRVNHNVWKIGPDGSFLTLWESYETGNGMFSFASGIAVNSSGFTVLGRSLYRSVQ